MADKTTWSTNAGQWGGIPVRIHLFLLLFITVIFGAEWNVGFPNENLFTGTAMVTALVFLLSVVIHELAHAFAARSVGGQVDSLVLMPWGGNSPMLLPRPGYAALIVHLAGPFANAMVFLFGLTLLVQTEHATLMHLVNPFEPHHFKPADWQVSLVEIATWVNFQLFLVNLIPCYPFDGAQIVRSLIYGSRVNLAPVRIEMAIKLIGHAAAFALIGLAILNRNFEPGTIQPAWLLVVLTGITLLFAADYSLAEQTRELEESWAELDELEYNQVYDTRLFLDQVDESDNIAYSQWLTEKQEERLQEQRELELIEDEQADAILEKLHRHGGDLTCLSDDERLLLHRFSERIRRRREHRV